MIVERIWTGNAYRNYNYLIACPESGEALAIDPLDHEKCLNAARVKGWQITQILNTHEHHDHTGGNDAVVAATGAKVIAHHQSGSRIAGVDRGVKAGDIILFNEALLHNGRPNPSQKTRKTLIVNFGRNDARVWRGYAPKSATLEQVSDAQRAILSNAPGFWS